MVVSKRQNR
jgi:hypothetical protein